MAAFPEYLKIMAGFLMWGGALFVVGCLVGSGHSIGGNLIRLAFGWDGAVTRAELETIKNYLLDCAEADAAALRSKSDARYSNEELFYRAAHRAIVETTSIEQPPEWATPFPDGKSEFAPGGLRW